MDKSDGTFCIPLGLGSLLSWTRTDLRLSLKAPCWTDVFRRSLTAFEHTHLSSCPCSSAHHFDAKADGSDFRFPHLKNEWGSPQVPTHHRHCLLYSVPSGRYYFPVLFLRSGLFRAVLFVHSATAIPSRLAVSLQKLVHVWRQRHGYGN
jgi:hypothetical protein